MNLSNAAIEQLCEALGKQIAIEEFSVRSSYEGSGISSIEWFCTEQLPETVWEHAKKEYQLLVNQLE